MIAIRSGASAAVWRSASYSGQFYFVDNPFEPGSGVPMQSSMPERLLAAMFGVFLRRQRRGKREGLRLSAAVSRLEHDLKSLRWSWDSWCV